MISRTNTMQSHTPPPKRLPHKPQSVAVVCVVGFFVWKFTQKRLGDYDNTARSPLLPKLQTFPPILLPRYDHTSCLSFFFFLNPTDIVTQMRRLSGQNSTPTTLLSPCQQTAQLELALILFQKRGEVRLDMHHRLRPTRLWSFSQTHMQSRPCHASTLTNPTTMAQARDSTIRIVARSRIWHLFLA